MVSVVLLRRGKMVKTKLCCEIESSENKGETGTTGNLRFVLSFEASAMVRLEILRVAARVAKNSKKRSKEMRRNL
jgi:hypothetical protein